jgi:predicted RNA-binding protein YlqC (UPF0109 family)
MKELIELVIKNLVDNPDQVVINTKNIGKSTCYEVKVAKEDMGKVIGKHGKMAKAIRTVVKAVANKEHNKISVEFVG